MDLSSLPDDLAVLVLQLCTCAALMSLEATCHHTKQLLQVPGAWRLPCDVHSLAGDDSQPFVGGLCVILGVELNIKLGLIW